MYKISNIYHLCMFLRKLQRKGENTEKEEMGSARTPIKVELETAGGPERECPKWASPSLGSHLEGDEINRTSTASECIDRSHNVGVNKYTEND